MTEDTHSLTEHLQTIKERVTEARKNGMDTKIVDIMMCNVMPKIMIAQATLQQADIDTAKRSLGEIENEMRHLTREEDFDTSLQKIAESERERIAKEEDVQLDKMSEEEVIERTNNLINQAREYMNSKNFEKVYPIYREIQGIYKYLPRGLKQQVYSDSMHIYKLLRESGVFKVKTRWQLFFGRLARRFGI
ncbi:MAG: hypothetical protein ABIF10_07810 [Candidatus Woesearchaeota archaeon]